MAKLKGIFKRPIVLIATIAVVSIGAFYVRPRAADGNNAPGGGGGFGGFGGPGGFGGGGRIPVTVELGKVGRADLSSTITVVGNLIGLQTVEATPKVAGRLVSVDVQLGDRVTTGQVIAKVEDAEIKEQVRQQQAAVAVSEATVRQREAGLVQARNNLNRSKSLFERQLIPRQTLDDSQASYDAAQAQLDLANAQATQAKARLDELSINLGNTNIVSPLTGMVARRTLDPGSWVTAQSQFVSVVDISTVRLVASIVEKDVHAVREGTRASVVVDAFPGETFEGVVAHVAPVLDPTTRTAQIEVEIRNPQGRLKPGMYARVSFVSEMHKGAIAVPSAALVDNGGLRGVYFPVDGPRGQVAQFHPVQTGLTSQAGDTVEITSGLEEGQTIVTTGAPALREGDPIVLPGQDGQQGGGQGGPAAGQGGQRGQGGQGGQGRRPGGQGGRGGQGGGQRQGGQGGGGGGGQRGGGQ